MPKVGVVAIGRNEGARLRACLASLAGWTVVYVDSGSSDDSISIANDAGAQVVNLCLDRPFSAARARNSGLTRLIELGHDFEYVQFVDGDCIVADNWIPHAIDFMDRHPNYAVVCGRRKELYPEHSLFNLLCDLEWNTPVGDTISCGGDSLMRLKAIESVGPFSEDVIAGEEPELCHRLARAGWRIYRADHAMTFHDAAMKHFSQWWRRSVRTGYGAALCTFDYKIKEFTRITHSALLWGVVAPCLATLLAFVDVRLSLIVICLYPISLFRSYRSTWRKGSSRKVAATYAFFCLLGKFPQVQGVVRYFVGKLTRKPAKIIEYKHAAQTQ